jgi:hypothetical protein
MPARGAAPLGERHTRFGQDATCSRLSTVPFATGPKRSMGYLLGGEKNNYFNSAILTVAPWRARRWNPVNS